MIYTKHKEGNNHEMNLEILGEELEKFNKLSIKDEKKNYMGKLLLNKVLKSKEYTNPLITEKYVDGKEEKDLTNTIFAVANVDCENLNKMFSDINNCNDDIMEMAVLYIAITMDKEKAYVNVIYYAEIEDLANIEFVINDAEETIEIK